MRFLILILMLSASAQAQTVWKVSVVAMASSTVADIVSTEMSHGTEANPLIPCRQNGKPQPGVYVAKAGFVAGMAALQYYVIKQHPGSKVAKVSTGKIKAGKLATVIDGAGGTLIPGLIDTHQHIMLPSAGPSWPTAPPR